MRNLSGSVNAPLTIACGAFTFARVGGGRLDVLNDGLQLVANFVCDSCECVIPDRLH
jgi:hypothetical protein